MPSRGGPYSNTSVNWKQTIGDVKELLDKYDCYNFQLTFQRRHDTEWAAEESEDGWEGVLTLDFIKDIEIEQHGDQPAEKFSAGVRIQVPKIDSSNRNQRYRFLYWYLKSKLEAIEYDFNSFQREFYSNLLAIGEQGEVSTVFDATYDQYEQQASQGQVPGVDLPALPPGDES